MSEDDLDDDLWGKIGGPAPEDADEAEEVEPSIQLGPPIRVTFLIRSETVPVAPWAAGWRVGAIGPENGHVTLVCEHDIDLSPVAQLSAVTGILGTIKQAQLDVVWWTIQTRGPIELDRPDLDEELSRLLDPDGGA